ncbi:MAG: anthranilate synthase component I family protein [Patescibacteria group bacterium]
MFYIDLKKDVFCSPIEVFQQLRTRGNGIQTFLLQSGSTGRWSFIGLGKRETQLNILKSSSLKFRKKLPKDAPPFVGGFVGFLSYDYGARLAGVHQSVVDEVKCPEQYWIFCDRLVAIDHVKKKSWIIGVGASKSNAMQKRRQIEKMVEQKLSNEPAQIKTGLLKPNISRRGYLAKIKKIKKYLRDGETYQVNFSQRFSTKFSGDPFAIYMRATEINPSPYQAYFESDRWAVVSNSPEELVRGVVKGSSTHVSTKPIKGTVVRGKNTAEDRRNVARLLKSEKDKAELTMIVDLERNDLGKVCVPGSVRVTRHRAIEKYSHVIHTVSEVVGILEKNKTAIDVLDAMFPGGSITGCPKKRTMEIIDELEDYKRGVYCGSAGYISLSGNFDFNIMIRTIFASNGVLSLHSGGGIVADSNAAAEYAETLSKAGALKKALTRDE